MAGFGTPGLRPMAMAAFVAFTGAWVANPLVALLLAGRGVPAATIGVLAASGWIASMLASLLAARAIRLLGGPARVFRAALAACACVVAGFGVADAVWQFAVLEPLYGMTISIAWTCADIGVIALAPPGRVSRTVGAYQTVVGTALCAGPVVLQFTGPGDPHSAFVAAGLLALGAALSLLVPKPVAPAADGRRARLPHVLPAVLVFAAMTGVAEAVTVSVLPVHALRWLGLGVAAAAAIPGFSAAGNLLVQFPLGVAAERVGVARLLMLGTVVMALATLAWPFVAGTLGGPFAMLAFGAATGVFYTAATLLVTGARLSGDGQARSLGLLNSGYLLGGALGAGAAGGVGDLLPGRFGLPTAIAVALLAIALSGLALLRRPAPAMPHDTLAPTP